MLKDITLTFHNQGLRSYIEVDLCRQCPRQDDKGCCGHYSPVFYPTDLAYLLQNQPKLINYIFSLDDITILDTSVTVNNDIDGSSYKCKFHSSEHGCQLSQKLRESICRHFVCAGISWRLEDDLQDWKEFFDQLFDYEIYLNSRLSNMLTEKGLTLRNPQTRGSFLQELLIMYNEETAILPGFLMKLPVAETRTIQRPVDYNIEWPL